MSTSIPVGFSEQFSQDVNLLLQQMDSRFRQAVEVSTGLVGEAAVAVEQVGAVTAQKRTTRHADTPRTDTPHDKRWVFPEDYEWSDLIDKQDRLRAVAGFDGAYTRAGAMSQLRAMDDEVISAFFSDTTKTGAGHATTTDWTTFVSANPLHQIAAGGGGLTAAKIKAGLKALRAAEVDLSMDPVFCAVSAEQIEDLHLEDQYINWDFTDNRSLQTTTVKPFLGVNFIHSERLGLSGSDRRCPMWAKSGMHLGIWEDVVARVDELPGKSYSTQFYTCMTVGATRTEEKKVVEILCAE